MTEISPDQVFSLGSLVTLIKKQVERLQDSVQAPREFLSHRDLERDARVANLLFRSGQPFGDGRFRSEERSRDFSWAKAAQRLERERHMGFLGDQRVAAHEHHALSVISD